MRGQRVLGYAIVFEFVGLGLEAVSIVRLRPISFMIFAGVALPCILIGVLLYLAYMISRLGRAERIAPPPSSDPGKA